MAKKYTVGQKIYILNLCNKIDETPVINEGVIEKAGNKYLEVYEKANIGIGQKLRKFNIVDEDYPYPEFKGKDYVPNFAIRFFDNYNDAMEFWEKRKIVREIKNIVAKCPKEQLESLSIEDLKSLQKTIYSTIFEYAENNLK